MKFLINIPDSYLKKLAEYWEGEGLDGASPAGYLLAALASDFSSAGVNDSFDGIRLDELTEKEFIRLKEIIADHIEITNDAAEQNPHELITADLKTLTRLAEAFYCIGGE